MIICGDFNSVLGPAMDRISQARIGPRPTDSVNLQDLLNSFNLQEKYRIHNPDTPGYTWTRRQSQSAARLDMFFCV